VCCALFVPRAAVADAPEDAPAWAGVTAVTVMGAFGQANDWSKTMPFLTITKGPDGTFTGSASLPAGTYAYLYRVVGDAATANPTTTYRYMLDPTNPDLVACPSGAPIYVATGTPFPCSKLTTPLGPAPAIFHRPSPASSITGAPASKQAPLPMARVGFC
jgi:hypothetical protein